MVVIITIFVYFLVHERIFVVLNLNRSGTNGLEASRSDELCTSSTDICHLLV